MVLFKIIICIVSAWLGYKFPVFGMMGLVYCVIYTLASGFKDEECSCKEKYEY
jgi:hypothetical protein